MTQLDSKRKGFYLGMAAKMKLYIPEKSNMFILLSVPFLLFWISGCSGRSFHGATTPAIFAENPDGYRPGLGDLMGSIQAHHTKLYYAGSAGNWPLALYEIKEIRENLEDAARFHPVRGKEKIADEIHEVAFPAVGNVEDAVAKRKQAGFLKSFDGLTAACNSCHGSLGYSYIKLQRPSPGRFSDQDFHP